MTQMMISKAWTLVSLEARLGLKGSLSNCGFFILDNAPFSTRLSNSIDGDNEAETDN